MQLMIDIATETAETLDIATGFLAAHAALKRASVGMPAGFYTEPNVPAPPAASFVPSPPAIDITKLGDVPEAPKPFPPFDARDTVFRGHTDVTPVATVPVVPAVPNVPSIPTNAPNATATVEPTPEAPAHPAEAKGTTELDASGMPWDERIHASTKAKKDDGTWRMKRGVDAKLVEVVTQELHARMINSTPAPVQGVPSNVVPFPGSLPLQSPPVGVQSPDGTGGLQIPQVPAFGNVLATHDAPPAGLFGQSPLPAGVVAAPVIPSAVVPPLPVFPAPVLGLPVADVVQAVIPSEVPPNSEAAATIAKVGAELPRTQDLSAFHYRELLNKVNQLRNEGRLTTEQFTKMLQRAGVPSMQQLGSMLHLVARVNFIVDATMAGWAEPSIDAHWRATGL